MPSLRSGTAGGRPVLRRMRRAGHCRPSLAEFKQVTILFADVVRSMDIAAQVGPERLREIMTDLFARSGDIVGRSGGTLNSYTGDGIMALFGAPTALEDHAFRACVAALDLQRAAEQLGAKCCGATAWSFACGSASTRVE